MRVKITYTEHLTYIHEKEIEMTKERYLKLLNDDDYRRLTYEAEIKAPSIDKAKWHLEAEGYRVLIIGEKK